MKNRGSNQPRPAATDEPRDQVLAAPSASIELRSKEPDALLGVTARAWGGLDASQWSKPSPKTPDEKRSFLRLTAFLAGAAALFVSWGVVGIWGREYGVVSFVAVFVLSFVISGVAQLTPRERHREVLLAVTNEVLRVAGEGAEIVLPLARISAFRVRDGARPGTTCFAVETDLNVVYFELDSTAALPILRALDSHVPSVLSESGLRADLLRRGQSLEEWARQLRSLVAPSGYRGGSLKAEHLFAAVGDERLGAEERIGAALALTGHPDAKTRDTLRATSKRISQEALKVAIQQVADDALEDRHVARARSADGHRWPA